jgi:hypothetical protein
MPLTDVLDISAGYVQRARAELPHQGVGLPWQMHTTFVKDNRLFKGNLVHEDIHFSTRTAAPRLVAVEAAS